MRATVHRVAAMSARSSAGLLVLAALWAAAAPTRADADGRRVVALLPAYVQECASCHIAYPPGALPRASWQRLMRNLPQHFGTDASLDAPTREQLSAWLEGQAGTWSRGAEAPPQDRISRSAWFRREHREVAPATWALPAVRTPSQCAACHPQAAEGDFNEDRIRIPR